MYADPHALLVLAAGLRTRADQVRHLAHALLRDTTVVEWHGFSADAMRDLAGLGHQRLLALAEDHDHAAALLIHHAHRVAVLLGVAVAAEQATEHALERAAEAVEHAGAGLLHAVERVA